MLDFDKVKTLSLVELAALFLCEFSRGVDALERIAPDATTTPVDEATKCPCPPELRVKCDAVMGEPVSFMCGLCGEVTPQPVGV